MDNYTNKKELSEEDIKNRYITPALNSAGWNNDEFRMELKVKTQFTDGKISLSGNRAHREKPKFADYVLYTETNYPIAVVEAKDNNHTAIYGLQQAMDYAVKLDIPFAYSSNGDYFVEHDFLTGRERDIPLVAFPKKQELLTRLARAKSEMSSVKYFSPDQGIINQPYYSGQNTNTPRYYQRIAINRTINAVANGQNRILLVMATGTGKTYTAFQIIYRLLKSGMKRKILYLADRNILVDQSIEQDFKPLERSIHKINFRKDTRETVGAYDVYFSLYQQLADRDNDGLNDEEDYDEDGDGVIENGDVSSRLEQLFSRDFFDLVIVDECHRGSAKEASNWHKILEYFNGATQIGMTATPKETNDVSNISYFGEPVYTYSLKEGIEDGFLAPFHVIEETTNITDGWRPVAGQLDENGNEIPDRIYTNSDFDTSIVLRDRTREVAAKITDYLKSTDHMQKTIVFCPTEDAADRMRKELINFNSDMVQENPDYIVRITGGDKFGKDKLDYFISVSEKYPVIATTSKLLSTGVDCKMVKLIVLDEVIGSMAEFKQIIGRGTRLRVNEGKTHFAVMDFRGNTKQFADPKWDGPVEVSPGYVPGNGGTTKPASTGGVITFVDDETPIVDSDGCKVQVVNEEVKIYDFESGKLIRTESLSDYIKRTFTEMFPTIEDFNDIWLGHASRNVAEHDIAAKGIDLEALKNETNSEDVDDYDLIRELVYNLPAKSRHERAKAVREGNFLDRYPDEFQKTIINLLLDKYVEFGLDEIEKTSVLKLEEFEQYGSPVRIAERFGGTEAYDRMTKDLIKELYK
ncbi:MAG: DEAD/DEAH box helicase family protein [Candidatus Saccharibacteria bacterium]|nr:DEAD/DEAH box helicase family protein [Candidatus Saccharibacteria bacterium]